MRRDVPDGSVRFRSGSRSWMHPAKRGPLPGVIPRTGRSQGGPGQLLLASAGLTAPVPDGRGPACPPGVIRDGRPVHTTIHGGGDLEHSTPRRARDRLPHRLRLQAIHGRGDRHAGPTGAETHPGTGRSPTRAAGSARSMSARRLEAGAAPGTGELPGHFRHLSNGVPPAVQLRRRAAYFSGAAHRAEGSGGAAPPEAAGPEPPGLFTAIGRGRWKRCARDSRRGC